MSEISASGQKRNVFSGRQKYVNKAADLAADVWLTYQLTPPLTWLLTLIAQERR